MKIGIYTYGTRGDVQPYIALALGLMERGHEVVLAAPSDFQPFVEGFGITFHALYGNAEAMMNSPEGQMVLKTEHSIKLMQFFFKALRKIKVPLRQSYFESISQVDYLIVNSATLPITQAIAEKQQKKIALTYFMPPVVPTTEFPLADFDFLNFPLYNKLTYKVAQYFYWKFVASDTNEYRSELGLPILHENLITYLERQAPLDLYCLSQALIPQPKDWKAHHQITGFLTVPTNNRAIHVWDTIPQALNEWLQAGKRPVYIGFGSNGIGNPDRIINIIQGILEQTDERIIFCSGWSVMEGLPKHKNLYITKYVNHEVIFPKCKVGVFHGGAGTLATMLRHHLPPIIVSFYTDQPTWGKIVERKRIGVHIPLKKLSLHRIVKAIQTAQSDEIQANVIEIGNTIKNEDGLGTAISEIEKYFMAK